MRQILAKVSETVPILFCPGNHDLGNAHGHKDDASEYIKRCVLSKALQYSGVVPVVSCIERGVFSFVIINVCEELVRSSIVWMLASLPEWSLYEQEERAVT